MKKQEKSVVIDKLSKDFQEAKSVTLVDFTGMNIASQNDLKNKLREGKSRFVVAKNTLIKIALTNAKLPAELADKAMLSGQTAIIMNSEDAVSPIQVAGKFGSENETLKFKAGVLEGVYQDKDSLIAVSKLPSKNILVGQTVGAIAGPMYALISNLQANIQELLGTLSAKVG